MAKKVNLQAVERPVKSEKGQKIVREAQSRLSEMNTQESYFQKTQNLTKEKAESKAARKDMGQGFKTKKIPAANTDAQREQFHGVNKKGVNTTEIRGVGSVKKVQGAAPEGRDGPTKDWSELDRGANRIPEKKVIQGGGNRKVSFAASALKQKVTAFTNSKTINEKNAHKAAYLNLEKQHGTPAKGIRPCAGNNCPNTVELEAKNADVTCASCTANEKKLQNTGQLNSILNRKRR
jgi:hypothetical protein